MVMRHVQSFYQAEQVRTYGAVQNLHPRKAAFLWVKRELFGGLYTMQVPNEKVLHSADEIRAIAPIVKTVGQNDHFKIFVGFEESIHETECRTL
jgi:hypothetical protein